MKICIILNGPPGCGKDTIGALLAELGYKMLSNKTPLIKTALAMSGVGRKVWNRRYANRTLKEEPWEALGGMSQREYLIWISEEVVKPVHGAGHYGKLATAGIHAAECYVVFTDGGFQEEMQHVKAAVGKDSLLLVHLFRNGFSFDEDSRNYMKPEGGQYLPLKLEEGRPNAAVDCILTKVQEMEEANECV